MKKLFVNLFPNMLPMVIIICVIVISLRICYLLKSRHKVNYFEEILSLIFIIYILCLFQVVSYQDINYGSNNFVPFAEITRYQFGSPKFLKNVLGNIILFIPYGFFTTHYLKNNKVSLTIFLTLIVSLTIETVQYYIGRVFDIDDIILNVCGGILGFYIYRVLEKLKLKLSKLVKGEGIFNFIILVIIVLIIIYSFNINIFFWLD